MVRSLFTSLMVVGILLVTGCAPQPQVRVFRPPPPPKSQTQPTATVPTTPDSPATGKTARVPRPKSVTPKLLGKIVAPESQVQSNPTGEQFLECALNSDGKILLTLSELSVRAWDVETGKQRFHGSHEDRWSCRYFISPSGKHIARVDLKSNQVELLRAEDGRTISSYSVKGQIQDFTGRVIAAFSPTGDRFLFINRLVSEDNKIFAIHELDCTVGSGRKLTFQEWPSKNGNERIEMLIPTASPDQVIVMHSQIVGGGRAKYSYYLWQAADNTFSPINWLVGEEHPLLPHLPLAQQLAFSSDRRLLLSQQSAGFSLTSLVTTEVLYTLPLQAAERYLAPTFTPDGKRFIINRARDRGWKIVGAQGEEPFHDDYLTLVQLKNGQPISSFSHAELGIERTNYLARQISLSADGQRVALLRLSKVSEVRIYDFESLFGVQPTEAN